MGVKYRYDKWYIRFWLDKHEVLMATDASGEREAQMIEHAVKNAIKRGSYDYLDPQSRDVCVRLFKNRGLEIPPSLLLPRVGSPIEPGLTDELTLKRACKLCYQDPETQRKSERYKERTRQCLAHLLTRFGPDTPVKTLKVIDIKRYVLEREQEGAAPATITRELGILSKTFRILMENELVDRNPVSTVKVGDKGMGRRRVYVSHEDFEKIVAALPLPGRPIAITAYYTGMRQGEARKLTRDQLLLDRRIIRLTPEDTKEQAAKVIPIHWDLMPILKQVLSGTVVGLGNVFLVDGKPVNRRLLARWWSKAVAEVGLPDLHFHDLRHTWKANARRSGVDEEIRASVMGHAGRAGSTHEGYGQISDKEYLDAIDRMTFDHGETDIWVCRKNNASVAATTEAQIKTESKPGLSSPNVKLRKRNSL